MASLALTFRVEPQRGGYQMGTHITKPSNGQGKDRASILPGRSRATRRATLTTDVAILNVLKRSGQAAESNTSWGIIIVIHDCGLHLLRLTGSMDADRASFLTCCNLVLKAVAPVDTSSRLCSSVRAASFSISVCSVLRPSMKSLRRCFRPSSHSLYSVRPCTNFFLNFHQGIRCVGKHGKAFS